MFVTILILLAGLTLGWFLKGYQSAKPTNLIKAIRLRSNDYKYISPLLMCNINQTLSDPTNLLKQKLEQYLIQEDNPEIKETTVYFRDVNSSEEFSINPEVKFYPASLNKIPLMIVYLKISQTDSQLLSRKVRIDDLPQEANLGEIVPAQSINKGSTYTIEEIINYMIKYSDNNAYNVLVKNIDPKLLSQTYKDLQIPLPTSPNPEDFLTASQFSHFLRVLYNSTYLNKKNSEKALEILSQVDYKNGLARPLPKDIPIAHKYGLYSVDNGDKKTIVARELHDCGIIYSNKPYFLCIMTKSTSSLSQSEKRISDISDIVYKTVK